MAKSGKDQAQPKKPKPKKGVTAEIEKGKAELPDEELNKVSGGTGQTQTFHYTL